MAINPHLARLDALERRFWSKVDKSGECWTWTACVKAGKWPYGKFGLGDKGWVLAHRMAWTLTHGDVPEGMIVCHRCDNPQCVRPEHLFLGTLSDNTQDMLSKGRHDPAPKYDERLISRVKQLRYMALPIDVIASLTGVHRSTVYAVISGRQWVQTGGPSTSQKDIAA